MSSDSKSVQGQCYCGAIRFELTFPTKFCSHCHCEDCRKSHGAPFVTWTSVPLSQFKLLAGNQKLRKYESHPGVFWEFCGGCGTSLFYRSNELPNRVDITVANLTGPLDREPDSHASFEEHVSWLTVADKLPQYRGKTQEPV